MTQRGLRRNFFVFFIFSFESENYAAHALWKWRTGILFYVLTFIKSSSSLFLTPTLHQVSLAGSRDSLGPGWTCLRLPLQLSHTCSTLALVQHFLEFSYLFLSSVPFPIVGLFLWKTPKFDFIWIWLWTRGECMCSLHLKAKVLSLLLKSCYKLSLTLICVSVSYSFSKKEFDDIFFDFFQYCHIASDK